MPLTFKNNDSIIIINTEKNVDASILDQYSKGMIVTKDTMTQKKDNGKIKTIILKISPILP